MRGGATGVLAVVATAIGMVAAAGCGGDDRDALTIYPGRTESLVAPLLEEFSQENDIPIDVRYGDTNDLALLIGTEDERVDDCIKVISRCCKQRTEIVPGTASIGVGLETAMPIEVTVGGATIFVTNVERFEKL